MIVCENCIHRYVCEDKYTTEPQYGCINYNSGKYMVIEELEKIKEEIKEIKMEKPLMSKGFECYGFKDKTPEDIKTEIIEMLDNRIAELKGEQE